MAVMTETFVAQEVVPIQRDRRAPGHRIPRRPVAVVRICSDAPIGAQLLLPAVTGETSIAPLLPIQRDRHARRARNGSTRRMTTMAVAFGISLVMWVAIIGAVAVIAAELGS